MPATAGAAAALAMAAESELGTELGPEAVGSALGTVEAAALRRLRAASMREPVYWRLSAPNPSLPAQVRTYDLDVSTRIKCFFSEVRLEFVLRVEINALVS